MRRLMTYIIPVVLYVLLYLGITRFPDNAVVKILRSMGINDTLFVVIPVFLFLLVVLDILLFQPILAILDRRDKLLADSRDLRDQYGRLAEEKVRSYQEKLLHAKQEAAALRNEARSKAQAELRQKVQQAKDASLAEVEKARAALAADMEKARAGLRSQAEGLGRELAGSFLGREAR